MLPRKIRSLADLTLSGKRVFLRVDFNVPIEGGRITEDQRIQQALPTIRAILAAGGRLIIASHLGRPKGKVDPKYSLEPVASHLAHLLNQDVKLTEDCVGDGVVLMSQSLRTGEILMLENLRFHPEEEANDSEFAQSLARLADVYVNDAFGAAHRKHASTYGMATHFAERGMGLLMQKEVEFLGRLIKDPPRPFIAVLGGAKVSDKIKTIESLIVNLDGMIIGGAMAFAFLAAQGKSVPTQARQPAPEDIEAAKRALLAAQRKKIPIYLPVDDGGIFDIGGPTLDQFKSVLAKARCVFWNGPMGWFEKPEFARGTFELARYIGALQGTLKVVGGGDTVAAVEQSGVTEGAAEGTPQGFDHLSTGGGAALEFLELGTLPGLEALK